MTLLISGGPEIKQVSSEIAWATPSSNREQGLGLRSPRKKVLVASNKGQSLRQVIRPQYSAMGNYRKWLLVKRANHTLEEGDCVYPHFHEHQKGTRYSMVTSTGLWKHLY